MTNYSIQVKKGEIQYSISSQDREFIVDYIDGFFNSLKTPASRFEDVVMPKLYAEKIVQNDNLAPITVQNDIRNDVQESLQEEKLQKPEEKTIDEMVKSLFEKSAEDTLSNLQISGQVEEKEDLSSLTDLLTPKTIQEDVKDLNKTEVFAFDSILEEKINNPVFEEAIESKNFDYDELLKAKQPESPMDYLIITAYYMLENENIEQFQLKQLNAKLFNSMKIVVDRKTVQKAIEDGLVTVVSDGIHNDGAVEYALTRAGQEFYINGLA